MPVDNPEEILISPLKKQVCLAYKPLVYSKFPSRLSKDQYEEL